MAHPADSDSAVGADDGILTAYLDGELAVEERVALEKRFLGEPALKVRLDRLVRGGRAFGAAYEVLLAAAPDDRLQAMLSHVVASRTRATVVWPRARWNSLAALAAAVVIFVLGGVGGHFLPSTLHQPDEAPGWRQVVAEYQGLTTAETLAAIPDNPDGISQELKLIGGKLALDLSPGKLVLPDAALKRADLFQFRGKPLVQLAYLTPESGPIAFCIIPDVGPDADRAFEERLGFNVVYWTDDGHSYMLIGKAPRAALETYAADLQTQV